jgi:hypothetical protein
LRFQRFIAHLPEHVSVDGFGNFPANDVSDHSSVSYVRFYSPLLRELKGRCQEKHGDSGILILGEGWRLEFVAVVEFRSHAKEAETCRERVGKGPSEIVGNAASEGDGNACAKCVQ